MKVFAYTVVLVIAVSSSLAKDSKKPASSKPKRGIHESHEAIPDFAPSLPPIHGALDLPAPHLIEHGPQFNAPGHDLIQGPPQLGFQYGPPVPPVLEHGGFQPLQGGPAFPGPAVEAGVLGGHDLVGPGPGLVGPGPGLFAPGPIGGPDVHANEAHYHLGHAVQNHVTVLHRIGVPVARPYQVPVERKVPVPVPHPVDVPVDKPYPVHVPRPYEVKVFRDVQVPIYKPVPVEVRVPYKVPIPVPYKVHVPQPVAVPVFKKIPVPVPHPVLVKKPVPVAIHAHLEPVHVHVKHAHDHHFNPHFDHHFDHHHGHHF